VAVLGIAVAVVVLYLNCSSRGSGGGINGSTRDSCSSSSAVP